MSFVVVRNIVFLSVASPQVWAKSQGCSAESSHVGTRVLHRVSVGDGAKVERTFLMTVPRAKAHEPKPLLFAFHGYGDSATEIAAEHTFDEMAEQKGFVVVYPEGMDDVPDGVNRSGDPFKNETWKSWNSGSQSEATCNRSKATAQNVTMCYKSCSARGLCSQRSRQANPCFWSTCADDVGFVKAIMDSVSDKACVDRSRIFGYGESNGGMLLYNPGIAAQFRAVAMAQALPLSIQPDSDLKIPQGVEGVLHLRALEDKTMPERGGESDDGWLYKDFQSTMRALCGQRASNKTAMSPTGLACEEQMCTSAQVLACSYHGAHAALPPGERHNDPFLWDFFERFKSLDQVKEKSTTRTSFLQSSETPRYPRVSLS